MIHRPAFSARRPGTVLGLAAVAVLAACAAVPDLGGQEPAAADTATRLDLGDEAVITDFSLGPPDARPGACYGKDVTPGVIEHVTERVLVSEAEFGADGNVIAPARYEERTTRELVTGREPIYFETPCPPRWTPEFIASLQRALQTRGLYAGPTTGELDTLTRAAIRRFQLARGLNSAILSTESARALGLVEVDIAG